MHNLINSTILDIFELVSQSLRTSLWLATLSASTGLYDHSSYPFPLLRTLCSHSFQVALSVPHPPVQLTANLVHVRNIADTSVCQFWQSL